MGTKPPRQRTCKSCGVKFKSPAAWYKHRGEFGRCRPIPVLPLYNLKCVNGMWDIDVRKKAKR